MSDFREELRVGKQILQRVVEAYRKIRNTCRYLLANLYDFDPARDRVPLDRDARGRSLSRSRATPTPRGESSTPTSATTSRRSSSAINQFATVDLSAFYADVSKDRLYTFAAGVAGAPLGADRDVHDRRRPGAAARADPAGHGRRAVAAPAGRRARRRCTSPSSRRAESTTLVDRELDARWERLIAIRDDVNRALEAARQGKTIGNSLGARVALRPSGATGALLAALRDDLPMLFIVSQVEPRGRDGRRGCCSAIDGRARRRATSARAAGASSTSISSSRRDRRPVRALRRRGRRIAGGVTG